MDNSELQPELSVQDVLKRWPQAAHVFLSFKTACVGCYLARFCTLAEVATVHTLDLHSILRNLKESIHSIQRSNTNEDL
jgi:hybrid cluster-associated redox disulfide protein